MWLRYFVRIKEHCCGQTSSACYSLGPGVGPDLAACLNEAELVALSYLITLCFFSAYKTTCYLKNVVGATRLKHQDRRMRLLLSTLCPGCDLEVNKHEKVVV